MSPLVSVIIPAYNAAAYITETINSVLNQTFKDIEIIVVDDGSTDQTQEVLKKFGDQIRSIRKENAGPASARNLGIAQAKGEFIAFLDSDDLWESSKIQKQLNIIKNNPGTGLVHTGTQVIDASGKIKLTTHQNSNKEISSFIDLFMKNKIAASSVLLRASCLKKSGTFDEDKSIISLEDYDLWLRIAADNKLAFIAEPLLLYRVHSSGISRNIERSYQAEEKVIRKIAKLFETKFPTIKNILNKRLAQIYFDCGSDYFYINNFAHARKKFKESLKLYPIQPQAFIFYMLTLIPTSWLMALKAFKKSGKK